MYIRQPKVPPLILIRQLRVINPQNPQDRRMQIMHMHRVLHNVVAEVIRLPITHPGFTPAPARNTVNEYAQIRPTERISFEYHAIRQNALRTFRNPLWCPVAMKLYAMPLIVIYLAILPRSCSHPWLGRLQVNGRQSTSWQERYLHPQSRWTSAPKCHPGGNSRR